MGRQYKDADGRRYMLADTSYIHGQRWFTIGVFAGPVSAITGIMFSSEDIAQAELDTLAEIHEWEAVDEHAA